MTRTRTRTTSLVALAAMTLLGACSAFMPEIGTVRGADDAGDARDAREPLALDASSSGDAASRSDAGPMTFTVTVAPNDSHTFSPADLVIHAGDTVHWVWDASGHTVTSGTNGNADGLFCSPNDGTCAGASTSGRGATYDHRFTATGTFDYFCQPHFQSGMVGSITVE